MSVTCEEFSDASLDEDCTDETRHSETSMTTAKGMKLFPFATS